MAVSPPTGRPNRGFSNDMLDRIAEVYSRVYSSCARFGMKESTCKQYARDAVADLTALVATMQDGGA